MRVRTTLALLLPFTLMTMGLAPPEEENPDPTAILATVFDLLFSHPPEPLLTPYEEIRLLEMRGERIQEQREQAIEDLKERQARLQELGWYEGGVDGIVGPLTLEARTGFQREAGLDVDPKTVTDEYVEALFSDDAPTAPEPEPAPAPAVTEAPATRSVWDRLADCESGNWVNGGASFEEGSARWYWAKPGTELPPWGTSIHHGGLQFHPGTWSSFKLDGYPQYAYDASREQQIAVAERVLSAQGWGAWPTCARKLGLR